MRWPLRLQIVLPFAMLLAVSLAAVVGVSAWNAAQQSRQQKLNHMLAVAEAIGTANFPLNEDVVSRIAAMIDGEVIVADPTGEIRTSTLPLPALPDSLQNLCDNDETTSGRVSIAGQDFLVTVIPRKRVPRPGPLFVMLPQDDLSSLRRDAILPPIFVGGFALLATVMLAQLIAGRTGRRVNRLRELFADLAEGRHQTVEIEGRDDELKDLLRSGNELSTRLQRLKGDLKQKERLDLLSQLSGGLAHQLKNSITGARMAVQLHQQNCSEDSQGMLDTAIAQLRLTEEQVGAVLSLRGTENDSPASAPAHAEPTNLKEMVNDVLKLLQPYCVHWNTDVTVKLSDAPVAAQLRSPLSVRGALLNLAMNAIEAGGIDGKLEVRLEHDVDEVTFTVSDNGPGFPQDTQHLQDAFRTTKPEGIGLGLTIAQHAVKNESGSLKISRTGEQTVVAIIIPLRSPHGPQNT